MTPLKLAGHVDDQHRLILGSQPELAPGPVEVWIFQQTEEDDAGNAWTSGVTHAWHDELADPREDIYTLEDGQKIDEQR